MANERLKQTGGWLLTIAFEIGAGLMALKEAWALVAVLVLAGVAIQAYAHLPRRKDRPRMIALAGMVVFGIAFVACAGVYFWPYGETTGPERKEIVTSHGFRTSERPWLEIRKVVAGPLAFDTNGGQLTFSLEVRNVGMAPALRVSLHPFVYLIGKDHMDMVREQKEACDRIRTYTAKSGDALYLGETMTLSTIIAIPRADIDKFTSVYPGENKNFVMPVVVGCVDYMVGGSTLHFQTTFGYMVSEGPGGRMTSITVPNGASTTAPIGGG